MQDAPLVHAIWGRAACLPRTEFGHGRAQNTNLSHCVQFHFHPFAELRALAGPAFGHRARAWSQSFGEEVVSCGLIHLLSYWKHLRENTTEKWLYVLYCTFCHVCEFGFMLLRREYPFDWVLLLCLFR